MAAIIDKLKEHFNNAPILKQLIFINVGVFIAIHLVAVILMLFNVSSLQWLSFIEVPSVPMILLYRPWTLFTYMFVHYDLWHLVFNMLWFYWFGSIFVKYFSPKHLSALYLLGGLSGAALYLLSYNIFPYFADKQGMMCGASASIMAIVLATTLRVPDFKVNLLFIGSVSLKYIAAATVLIDLLSMTSPNAGGHFAHLGGAIMGVLFGIYHSKGKDILYPIIHAVDIVVSKLRAIGTPRIKFKTPKNNHDNRRKETPRHETPHQRPESDSEYLARKKRENDEIDRILDKIKKSGYSALTTEEKQKLFDARK